MKGKTVLHVTESLGGGTATAMFEFVESTPDATHHLVACTRTDSEVDVDLSAIFASAVICPTTLSFFSQVRRSVRELTPDIVHLHSSWAGLLGRLSIDARKASAPRVLYSPHCFYFERRDISEIRVHIARATERLLRKRTSLVVGVSPHEVRIAAGLGMPAVYVPNTSRRVGASARPDVAWSGEGRPRIVTVGRVCEQKDPRFLIDVKRDLATRGRDCEWTWIGDGDDSLTDQLGAEGIAVTGWLSSSQVQRELCQAQVYVHTAAWESNPMSILEAAELKVPLAVRSIPSLVSLGLDHRLNDPAALAGEIDRILAVGVPTSPELQDAYRAAHTPERQRMALANAYGLT